MFGTKRALQELRYRLDDAEYTIKDLTGKLRRLGGSTWFCDITPSRTADLEEEVKKLKISVALLQTHLKVQEVEVAAVPKKSILKKTRKKA